MANNRMYLVNTRTGQEVYLAKFFPSTGWYVPNGMETLQDRLNKAFDESDFSHLSGEEKLEKSLQVGFGPPYSAATSVEGEEWKIEYRR